MIVYQFMIEAADKFGITQALIGYSTKRAVEDAHHRQSRPPTGEPRNASQRRTRPAETGSTRMMPQWSMGDRVRWQDQIGHFHRDLGDGNAEVTIVNRAYRVRIGDLRP